MSEILIKCDKCKKETTKIYSMEDIEMGLCKDCWDELTEFVVTKWDWSWGDD